MIFSSRQESARYAVIAVVLVVMAGLLFFRLGHYALWNDEAMVGLAAKGVVRTGDTSVLLDHGNVLAYRGGILVKDFRDRSTPPLATYLTAVSYLLFGTNAWAARLPFAMLGLATVALILYWARRESWPLLLVLIAGLLGNVSLILFFRQCRYFGPTIFFSVAIVFVYWRWKPTPRTLLTLAGLSVLLFVANYMTYLAFYLCLAVDYAIWKRKEWPPTWSNGLLLLGPQLILNGAVACVWNPLRTHESQYEAMNGVWDRLTLFFWYWRDLSQCEFIVPPILLLALILGLVKQRAWLVRGCVALFVYVTAITLIAPQPVRITEVADVRYLPALIPLAIAMEAAALCILFARKPILLAGAALIVFGTNLLNGGPFLYCGLRSTLWCYAGELLHPVPEPYTPTAQWINEHIPEGESVWVWPDYAVYPLMFHAPAAIYAWQLNMPPRPDFAGLPRIHFLGQDPPDYIIAFGPYLNDMERAVHEWKRPDVRYRPFATINVFWKDRYRPELFWHGFAPFTNFNGGPHEVYIFQRSMPPIPVH